MPDAYFLISSSRSPMYNDPKPLYLEPSLIGAQPAPRAHLRYPAESQPRAVLQNGGMLPGIKHRGQA
jgi:hypothetical protein